MDLFKTLLPSIDLKTMHLFEDDPEQAAEYVPFIVNKAYSFGADTILYANEMNRLHFLPKRLQYDFYFYGLDKRKRFNKWIKQNQINNIETIKEYFQCSNAKAKQFAKLLTSEQIDEIEKTLNKGKK